MRRALWVFGVVVTGFASGLTAATRPAVATHPAVAAKGVDREELRERITPAVERAFDFLRSTQGPDGGWHGEYPDTDAAITALVAKAFAQWPAYGPKHPVVQRAIRFVLRFRQADGGIYSPTAGFGNYSTSVALMALASMKSPELDDAVRAAQGYLKDNQWIEGKRDADGNEIDTAHPWYGGAGYGQHKRPDLSNTQMMLEALHESGLSADDPAFKKALKFIERCQMNERINDQPYARGATDGGFIYSPANGGESKAGTVEQGGRKLLRSYGSMTYAGFKSMLYAKLTRDDPRVRAAWDWIRSNYTLDSNPNMPGAQSLEGLYYFYHIFARALQASGEPFVVDPDEAPHDWRADLAAELLERQRPDGSWVNGADRWHEGDPHLVTAYSVLALEEAIRPDAAR